MNERGWDVNDSEEDSCPANLLAVTLAVLLAMLTAIPMTNSTCVVTARTSRRGPGGTERRHG